MSLCTHLLVELNVLHNLQGECEVTEKTVDTQETDDTEVSEHAVQWTNTILANDLTGLRVSITVCIHRLKVQLRNVFCTLAFLKGNKVLIDFRFLDERVEDVQDAVGAPDQ